MTEARARRPANENRSPAASPAAVTAPTQAQVDYLKKLTHIRGDEQLGRYIARRLGLPLDRDLVIGRREFSRAIDLELAERRRAA